MTTYRVIVIDDEEVTASAHAQFIRERPDFEVAGTAYNAQGAIAAIKASFARKTPVDLLLLDINLPDRSGHEVAKFLRAEGLPVDVIMVTADRDASSLRTASLHGAFGYLVKPFTAEQLRDRLLAYARYHRHLGQSDRAVTQDEIDQAMRLLHEGDRPPLPKGHMTDRKSVV